jgi:hypothetical protein
MLYQLSYTPATGGIRIAKQLTARKAMQKAGLIQALIKACQHHSTPEARKSVRLGLAPSDRLAYELEIAKSARKKTG